MMTNDPGLLIAGGIPLATGISIYAVHVADLVSQWWHDSQERLDRLATLPEPQPVVKCGECGDELDDTNRAPSCLSHDTCLDCSPTTGCTECGLEYVAAIHVADPFDVDDRDRDFDWGWTR